MDQLWAPWRLAYVTTNKPTVEVEGCFICQGLARDDDRAHLIALRTPLSVVVLNRFPYNNGHLLIAPQAHKGQPHELTAEETIDVQQTICRCIAALVSPTFPQEPSDVCCHR